MGFNDDSISEYVDAILAVGDKGCVVENNIDRYIILVSLMRIGQVEAEFVDNFVFFTLTEKGLKIFEEFSTGDEL